MPFRLLCAFLLSVAVAAAQSSVWKVTRGGRTLYLGGTIHLLRASDFPLPPEFDAAFERSARLVFETDIGGLRSPVVQAQIAAEGFFTDGRTLRAVLSPAAWQAAADHCRRQGLPLESFERMKPWLFALSLAIIELQKIGISGDGVDLHLWERARAAGKTTDHFETIEEQLGFIARVGAGQESEFVLKSLADLDAVPRILPAAIAAWRRGDLPGVERLLLDDWDEKFPEVHRRLILDRNAAWLPRMLALLDSPEIEFVLVGAGHLPGQRGLLALLRERGCTLDQLRVPAAGAGKRPAATKPR